MAITKTKRRICPLAKRKTTHREKTRPGWKAGVLHSGMRLGPMHLADGYLLPFPIAQNSKDRGRAVGSLALTSPTFLQSETVRSFALTIAHDTLWGFRASAPLREKAWKPRRLEGHRGFHSIWVPRLSMIPSEGFRKKPTTLPADGPA
jgi:hypothetical protein